MDSKIQAADDALRKSNILIGQEALGNTKAKETRERTRKVLSATQQVVDVVEGVSELIGPAKAATVVFKALIRLEANRRENNEQIVVVCYNMSITMYVLRYLDARINEDEDLSEQLREVMCAMEDTMKAFGDFADLYYTKAKHLLVRLLRSSGFKERLSAFVEEFARHRQQIELIVSAQSWGRQAQIDKNLQQVQHNSELILQRLGAPASSAEKAVKVLIDQHGGADYIVQDRAAIDAIVHSPEMKKADSSPVTTATRNMLNEDLDVLLQQNQDSFERKLDSAQKELEETIARSTAAILRRFDEGPHEYIEDSDIKEMWKNAGWKLTVKTRYFGEALFNHFSNEVTPSHDSKSNNDSWALDILGKVIYYPAIGEAIDEDASGSLSVHEVNHFLIRNTQKYPTPVWLAYWAVGWRYMNSCLTDDVCDMLDELENGTKALAELFKDLPEHPMLESVLAGYRDTVADLQCLGTWNDYNDDGMDALREDIEENVSTKLEAVATEIFEREKGRMKVELEQLEYMIDDPALLTSITSLAGLRIEQVFWSLLACVLERHVTLVKTKYNSHTTNLEDLAALWQGHDRTLTVLVEQLYQRYKSLQRSWRSQKLDVEVEVECYAGGFFYGWYTESQKPGDNKIKQLEAFFNPDNADESDENEDQHNDDDDQQSGQDVSKQITAINARLDTTNARLDATDALLQQLLAAVNKLVANGSTRSSPPEEHMNSAPRSRKMPQRGYASQPRRIEPQWSQQIPDSRPDGGDQNDQDDQEVRDGRDNDDDDDDEAYMSSARKQNQYDDQGDEEDNEDQRDVDEYD